MTPVGAYIHVPFCATKCPYCDFYSEKYSSELVKSYKNAVIRRIMAYPYRTAVDTIYFGGGTPSLISEKYIEEILNALYSHFSVKSLETTIEVNPKTVNYYKLSAYHSMGINRLSIGVQSCNDKELEFLGRKHSWKNSFETIENAARAGFDNISCDLMIGLDGQTISSLRSSINTLVKLPIQHISSYMLKIEANTPFNCESIISRLPDEDAYADMYLFMVDHLNSKGFAQYEISNFARSGFESIHNNKYWQCKEYIGIGPSAHSYFNGKRYTSDINLEQFISSENADHIITDDNPCSYEERLMLGLRLKKGIRISDFPELDKKLQRLGKEMLKNELIEIKDNVLSLTAKGFLISNSIISSLL